MPAVLRQLSLIVTALAGVITILAGRTAGIRATQLGLRTVLACAIFFVGMSLLSRAVVAMTPDAWSGVRRPPNAVSHLGGRLDVTVPGASPADAAFTPIDPMELTGAAPNTKGVAEAVQRITADPEAMARILATMSQGDQEG